MEPMHIIVESVQQKDADGLYVAKVHAASHERVGSGPRALIHLTIRLDANQSMASEERLERIAKDEALRFLDIE